MLLTLLLGWAVGTGSTPLDTWFARNLGVVVGPQPRWLLAFTSWWLLLPVLVACLVITARRQYWRLSVAVLVCPLIVTLVNVMFKHLFNRRNGLYLEYPSGHTALLVAVLGMMVVVAGGRLWAIAFAILVSLLGMLGLVACGYHYLTDTIGAALLATALVCVATRLASRSGVIRSPRNRAPAVFAVLCVTGVATSATVFATPDPGPSPRVPPVSTAAQAVGLVDVRGVVPNPTIDLRYATPNNFTGVPLYPPGARCLVHESLASPLATAAETLRRQGRRLVFWDCYRPHQVQQKLFEAVPDPNWVARPGPFSRSHETGRSVDVTLLDPTGRLVEMGTGFDDFSPRAVAFATRGISEAAVANRAVLRDAMNNAGLATYSGEWWHFDGPGAGVQRPIVDVPVG